MRSAVAILLAGLALSFSSPAAGQPATTSRADDSITAFLLSLEQVIRAGDPDAYGRVLAPIASREEAQAFAADTIRSGITAATIRERDRVPLDGALPGDGYRLIVELLIESGRRARIVTLRLDLRRAHADTPAADGRDWRIAGQEQLGEISGLHRLTLTPAKVYSAHGLTVTAEDLVLRLDEGHVYVAEVAEGVTAMVLVGRGEMRFAPGPAAERGQLKIFSGAEILQVPFDVASVRLNPGDFAARVAQGALRERAPDARDLRRASQIFDENVAKSFSLDLSDLSRDVWSLVPTFGDLLAEVRTKRYGTLTYARSGGEAEDVTLFDRRRHRNISVYASEAKLAARGRFYDEDKLADFDILDYSVDSTFLPERERLEGRTTLKLKARFGMASLGLKLAESLVVTSVSSLEYGRLLFLRVRGQNSVLINLPVTVQRDSEFSLTLTYGGRLPPQPVDREAIQEGPAQQVQESPTLAPEPYFLYSSRGHWYPQSSVTDYATATIRLTVPDGYGCVASGEPAAGSPVLLAEGDGPPRKLFHFVARQPLRYLAFVISRFMHIETTELVFPPDKTPGLTASDGNPISRGVRLEPDSSATYDRMTLSIEANPRQQGRGRELSERSADIIRFYTSILGDYPYPIFTLAVTEDNLPGGHSPAYFAVLHQTLPTMPYVWRNDPVAFDGYPHFFIAHELAHQWWGQAVGWKNYHEQWLSEGLAQYFAVLYAERERGASTFTGIMRQIRRTAMAQSPNGPIALGYRLGHVQGESRVFRALVYNKAAAVLHMLRRLIGDEAFFDALRAFYAEWRFKKAGSDDLRRAFEQRSGRSLERFFERWIYASGLPRLRFSHQVDGAGKVRLRFEQIGEVFDVPVTVTLHFTSGEPLTVSVPVTDQVTETIVPLSGRILRRVEVNDDEGALAEIVR